MLSSLSWIPVGSVKPVPAKYEMTEKEEEEMRNRGRQRRNEEEEEEEGDEMEDEGGKAEQRDEEDDEERKQIEKDFDMDNYDEEDDSAAIFGGEMEKLMLTDRNEEEEVEDDEDALSDIEDITIKPTDRILIGAHSEDDISHLDIYLYEPEEDNLYVHHDILLGSFPLALAWLDYHPTDAPQHKGNLVAVGTFDTGIELWDLDVIDVLEPTMVLGGERERDTEKNLNKKMQKKKPSVELVPGSHTASVMSLAWNKHGRNILGSGSADHSIKIWDLTKGECVQTLNYHKDKVQSICWHPNEPATLASGAYDKKLGISDVRDPKSFRSYQIGGDVEVVQWNPHSPHHVMVSSEDGSVTCFDQRQNKKKVWQLNAHSKPVSGFSMNPAWNYFVTGSTDKTVKFWSLENEGKPSLLYSQKIPFGIYSLGFCLDSPSLLALGGEGPDNEEDTDPLKRIHLINTDTLSQMAKVTKNTTTTNSSTTKQTPDTNTEE
eukprot:TRINITY_DN3238_c0_g2_i1.p1 TRINITY_DN3238_c0_g2~~TRINITY_DN3238_c0_g2_i1.p1  ORF type:complete len:489 (-),score=139.83 TRINITY_DN3238_c0_g2_i1:7-1473(-)